MIEFRLESFEAAVLRATVLADLSELGDEIAKTDSHDYRNGLKEKRKVLERIVGYLEEG